METYWNMKFLYVESWIISSAFLIDIIFGDPKRFHPVIWIGNLIDRIEKFFRKKLSNEKLSGVLLFLTVTGIVFLSASIFIHLLDKLTGISGLFSVIAYFLLIFTGSLFIALRGLINEARRINDLLITGNLKSARQSLCALVGRDAETLTAGKIKTAVVESLAENLSDAVIAPLFYFIVGGFPFLVLYKTVNTLDSMVGYKNNKYIKFGWFSAKMDDIFNYIPARISGLMIVLSSLFLLGFSTAKNSFRIMLRDGKKHTSPNSGIPEAAMAGALKIKLGGPNYYGGVLVEKPYIGENSNIVESSININNNIIVTTIDIVILSSFLFLFIALIIRSLL